MFPKPVRNVDKTILEKYRNRSCDYCGAPPKSQPCHIKTRGSGGPDCDDNLYSGCLKCHVLQGTKGFWFMSRENPFFGQMLAQKGWVFNGSKQLRRAEGNHFSSNKYPAGKL